MSAASRAFPSSNDGAHNLKRLKGLDCFRQCHFTINTVNLHNTVSLFAYSVVVNEMAEEQGDLSDSHLQALWRLTYTNIL